MDQAQQSLKDTEDFVKFVRGRCLTAGDEAREDPSVHGKVNAQALVQPIITPRFAIACSDELLEGLGQMLARDPSLPCQTHLAENPSEIAFTKSEHLR